MAAGAGNDTSPADPCDGLMLLVTSNAPRSQRARTNLRAAIDEVGAADLEIREVDVLTEPSVALKLRVFATPALVCVHDDVPDAVLYGDLSNHEVVLQFLEERLAETD